MKKTWFFGIAFTLGISTIPCVTFAQYAPTTYGGGALAPSGYPVSESLAQPQPYMIPQVGGYAQPAPYQSAPYQPAPQFVQQPQPAQAQYPQGQFTLAQQTLPQNGQYTQFANGGAYAQPGVPAQMIAYPQDQIPAPTDNSVLQRPEEVWPDQVGQQPLQQPGLPQPIPLQADGAPPIPGAPINGSTYGADNGYAQALAPTATGGPYSTEFNGAACGGAVAGAPVDGPFTTFNNFAGKSAAWFNTHYGAPGRAWFVGGGAMLMRRVDDNNLALLYDGTMPTDNVLGTRDARQHHLDGFEVFTGRYFNCGRNALMLSYWGLFPGDESATVVGGSYMPFQQFNGVQIQGQDVYDWYDRPYAERVVRSSQYHNVEANLLGFAVGGAARTWSPAGCGCGYGAYNGPCCLAPNVCGSRCNWTWLAGVRWFRFTDSLQWAASDTDADFNGSADDLYWDNEVRNDLVGFQLGGIGNYCLGSRVNLYALSKAGIYNNHSQLYSRIGTNGGAPETATIVSGNAYNGSDYLINANQNNAAFLGEIGTGVGVRISRGWSANVGYRVIGASGIATAVNTMPGAMLHLGNVAEYNNTSSLLLHGVTVGGTYNF